MDREARNEEESIKRSHSFSASSNSPLESDEKKQRKNTATIIRLCLQKRPTETSREAARKRAEAPLFPQRSKGYVVARTDLTAAEKEKTHRSRGVTGAKAVRGATSPLAAHLCSLARCCWPLLRTLLPLLAAPTPALRPYRFCTPPLLTAVVCPPALKPLLTLLLVLRPFRFYAPPLLLSRTRIYITYGYFPKELLRLV